MSFFHIFSAAFWVKVWRLQPGDRGISWQLFWKIFKFGSLAEVEEFYWSCVTPHTLQNVSRRVQKTLCEKRSYVINIFQCGFRLDHDGLCRKQKKQKRPADMWRCKHQQCGHCGQLTSYSKCIFAKSSAEVSTRPSTHGIKRQYGCGFPYLILFKGY